MGKTTRYTIVLVRTGTTDWDSAGRLIGTTDLPMNAEGEAQFHAATKDFYQSTETAPEITTLLTTSEESAQKGAAILNFGRSAKIRELEGLENVGLGLWEGVLITDLEDRFKSAFREWSDSPVRMTPPEGESLTDAQDRLVGTILKALRKAKGGHPVVGVVLRPMAWALVRAWLRDQELGDVWETLDQPITVETIELPVARVGSTTKRVRASA